MLKSLFRTNMELCCFICLLCFFIEKVSSTEEVRIPAVDALIGALQREQWVDGERPCVATTLDMLHQVKNMTLWATWVWDANQYPVGGLSGSTHHMGNWDQCMNPPWLHTHPHLRTQYCTAEVTMIANVVQKDQRNWDPYEASANYLSKEATWGIPLNKLYWGVCLPSSCRPRSVAKILKHMYRGSQYGPVTATPNITVEYCQTAGEREPYSFGYYAFFGTVLSLLALAVGSTVYQSRVQESEQHPGSLETIITKSFCVKKNYNSLIKQYAEEIHVMNGMRFITAFLIVVLHQIFFFVKSPIVNSRNIIEDLDTMAAFFFPHMEIVVDTFFAMSGLLFTRGLLSDTGKQKNLIALLFKRYIRLFGPFAITVFYLTSVVKFAGTGPLWDRGMNDEIVACSYYWRRSLLMINTNTNEICHCVTWYISCDYQLAILSTVLFYFYQKDKRLGFAAFGVVGVLSLVIPGFLTYWYKLPAMPFPNMRSIQKFRQYTSLELNYTKSYVRAGAYLVGVAMGYFISIYKPAHNRRKVSVKWSMIGVLASVALILFMMGLGWFFLYREYNIFEAVVASALNRVLWSVGVCCIIAFCEYGTVPIIGDFLRLPAFTALSRLSYSLYVIHPLVIHRRFYTTRSPLLYEKFAFVTDTLGTAATSIVLSFAMWLLVEAPCINLSNSLLIIKSKSTGEESTRIPSSKEPINGFGIPAHNGDKHHKNNHEKTKML